LSGTTSAYYSQVTYSELISTIDANSLNPGSYYLITDFKTCYDQPDYNIYGSAITQGIYKVGNTHSILVLATSENTLSTDAWQPDYPNDIIKYDFSWIQTERTSGTAYGRISERIDEWNNRTDYDHRDILFKRYDTFVYNINTPQAGTISVLNGVVTGVGTDFTNFSVGNTIAIPYFSELFFNINTISGATAMSLTGSIWNVTANEQIKYYSIDYTMDRCSYKKNNVDNVSYEISTFGDALENNGAFNNYIGNHANSYYFGEIGEFLLSNNVFLQGSYYNNNFGNNCYNNTFDDDCTDNTIGNFFRNNITDDDFDGNQICNYFENNLITANFQRNHVGENFNNNIITNDSFYRNRIGEGFEQNKISGDNFQNNIIGNAFNYNDLYLINGNGFLKNVIGVGFNNNILNGQFDSNTIGNGSNYNEFYGNIYENKIGDYFENNNFGTNVSSIDFYENHIGNNFQDNNVYNNFYKNYIGYQFEENTIGDFEYIGDAEFYQNKIGNIVKGNLFIGYNYGNEYGENFSWNELSSYTYANKFGYECIENTLGEYFNNNIIGNYFGLPINGNTAGNYFQYNNISNNFNSNTIGINFAYNIIGNNFENNTIGDDFGFGGGESRGNKIGNYFTNNTIGEYFYDNTVADVFDNNLVGNDFQLNDIKIQNVYDYDFTTNLHKIVTIAFTATGSSATDGTYSNISGATTSSINGINATFDILVNSGVVTSVSVNSSGKFYEDNDEITILGTQIGGTAGTDNISISVTEIYTPSAYENYNCDIFKRKDGEYRLSYYDENDILTIKDIIE
jgi:hypothetical protein